jgi:hypothetical protein
MGSWLYALLCVAAPMLWALFMFRLVTFLEQRSAPRNDARDSLPPPDYSI